MHPFRAQKLVEAHVKFDRESMRMLAEVWDPEISVFENPDYIRIAAQRNAELERAMMGDRGHEAEPPRPGLDAAGPAGGTGRVGLSDPAHGVGRLKQLPAGRAPR